VGLGEAFNFAAYAMVAASLVTPLGALSVLVSAVLASKFLDEKLNLIGKIGCTLCLLGSTVIVIHAPTEGEVDSLDQLSGMLLEIEFLIYITIVILTSFVLITIFAPKYGQTNVLVYVLICSLIGSLSVMSCKALGLGIRETMSGQENQMTSSLFWFFLMSVIVTVSIQMNYLNKALDVYETSLVTPIYYVFFTTFVLIASSILFKEWKNLLYQDMTGIICGFLIIIIAVFLLNAFSEFDITFEILRKHWIRQKTQRIASRNRLEDLEGMSSSRDYLISPSSQSHYQSALHQQNQAKILGKKLRKTKKSKRTISGGSQSQPPVRPQLLGSDTTDSDI
jgi:drug/metabolite transporter (DMT)-like permease